MGAPARPVDNERAALDQPVQAGPEILGMDFLLGGKPAYSTTTAVPLTDTMSMLPPWPTVS